MLDVSIRVGILNLMLDLKEREQLAFLYVTHDLASARYIADYMLVMYAGQIVEQGPVDRVLQSPLHPYTQLLIDSVPDPAGRRPRAHRDPQGRRLGRDRPTRRLPIRRPLPAPHRRLHADHARARPDPGRPQRTLPRHRTVPRHSRGNPCPASSLSCSRRLRLGRRDRLVPDRGRDERGRPRRKRLGPVLRHAGQGSERRQRRRRVRLLPPLPRRHRADARARPRRVPLLDRLAAGPAGRDGPRQRGGARLLRPARRRAARQRDRAVRDALPLGHAAGDRGRRRLAGARHDRRVRRVRRGRRRHASATASRTGSRTTSPGSSRGSATAGAITRRAASRTPTRSRPPITCCSRTAARSRSCAELARRRRSGSRSTSTTRMPASESPEDVAAARWVDGLHNRWFLDPLFRGSYPDDMLEAWAEIMPEIADGDLEIISTPIDFLGVNNYTSPLVAADDERRPLADRAPRRRRPHRHGLGGRPGRAARPARPAPPRLRSRRRST